VDACTDPPGTIHYRQIRPLPGLPFHPTSPTRAATAFLIGAVNDALQEYCRPVLSFDTATRKPVFAVRPSNLLGVMWLQLAHAISRGDAFRVCRGCGRWLRVNAEEIAKETRTAVRTVRKWLGRGKGKGK
jgi:hypothetical protein